MAAVALSRDRVDALVSGMRSYEEEAESIFAEARRAASFIPQVELKDVFDSAPEMEFHHRFIQSILTWVWYEVHENEVPLECLPDPLGVFFLKYEKPFATYWTVS